MTPSAILPGATIGIVGGGQLGRMLALEAVRMGYRVRVLDPSEGAPAAQVADGRIRAGLDEQEALIDLARHSDIVTLEWENADVDGLRRIADRVPLRPSPAVLAVAQNRLREKTTANGIGVSTAGFRPVGTLEELRQAAEELGFPCLLKLNRGGYDGRGQWRVEAAADLETLWADAGERGIQLILEEWVDYELEVSVICARTPSGEIRSFPVVQNIHVDGILDTTICPAPITGGVAAGSHTDRGGDDRGARGCGAAGGRDVPLRRWPAAAQ